MLKMASFFTVMLIGLAGTATADHLDELVRVADRFPSTSTTVGLGRSFAWNQWARVNNVVDASFRVRRTSEDRARFLTLATQLQDDGNALDARAA